MNAPILRLREAVREAQVTGDAEKLNGILHSIELAFEVKDRALRQAKSVLENFAPQLDLPFSGTDDRTLRKAIDEALMPWSHNSDEVQKP